jgi:hypothetical protein
MRGPRLRLKFPFAVLIALCGLTAAARAEMLVGALTTQTAPGDFKAPAPGQPTKAASCGRPAAVFRAGGPCPLRGAGWAVSAGQEELDLLETLMTVMVFSDQWIYQTNGTYPPPQIPPQTLRSPPPVQPPPRVVNTPEPATLLLGLLGSALSWLGLRRRRQPGRPGEAALLPQAA